MRALLHFGVALLALPVFFFMLWFLAQAKDTLSALVVLLMFYSFAAVVGFTAYIAAQKQRSFYSWFFLAVFFGPIALFAIGVLPTRIPAEESPQESKAGTDDPVVAYFRR